MRLFFSVFFPKSFVILHCQSDKEALTLRLRVAVQLISEFFRLRVREEYQV